MPRLPTAQLIQSNIHAFDESNASGVLISSPSRNPRRFIIQSGQEMFELWVYIWTLTHGGGKARPANEYRIQITGITPPIDLNPSGPTIMIGFEPNIQCFAGFDISKHKTFSTRSPSIQIPITALRSALRDGFSFSEKGNEEIAIGFRPDQYISYALNAELLHLQGTDAVALDLLTRAVALEELSQDDLGQVPEERQRVIKTVSRLTRDAGFRRRVVAAYERRCAVTGLQLRLIDAAHILPVGVEGSTDNVSNGICLSPTYHRAFDRGLVFLDDNFIMQINREKEQELTQERLSGGVNDFKNFLGRRVHLPQDRQQWPNVEMIIEANRFRGI
ncbi:MAG: HNH endonuclease [Chloroflexi bacterium]|nr:HNH endonuclease [Chloroflexota bacterium]